jgi:hypothetical protein
MYVYIYMMYIHIHYIYNIHVTYTHVDCDHLRCQFHNDANLAEVDVCLKIVSTHPNSVRAQLGVMMRSVELLVHVGTLCSNTPTYIYI